MVSQLAPAAVDAAPRSPHERHARRVRWLLVALALAVVVPVIGRYTAQPASRYALTAALAEHGTVDLGRYRHELGIDYSRYEGHLRSDKAPGQPIVGVPAYWVGRALGFDPATDVRRGGDLGVWWQSVWASAVPFALLLALMFTMCRRYAPSTAAYATLAIGFGTMLLLYGSQLYGHVLAALLSYGAWLSVEEATRWSLRTRLALAGLLASVAIAVEYHAGIAAAVVFAIVVARHRLRALWYGVGAVPAGLVVAWYHRAAFGAPWRLPYGYYATKIANAPTDGGYDVPSLHDFADVLIGNKGLMVSSPIVVVAFGVAGYCLVRRAPGSSHAAVAVAVGLCYLLLVAGWSGSKLIEDPGPRYLVPAFPFFAVPLAVGWQRVRLSAAAAAAWGALVMVGATLTPHLTNVNAVPAAAYLSNAAGGKYNANVWVMLLGPAGWVVYAVTVCVIGAALLTQLQRDPRPAA